MMNVKTLANNRYEINISYHLINFIYTRGEICFCLYQPHNILFSNLVLWRKPKCFREFGLFLIFPEIEYILNILLVSKMPLLSLVTSRKKMTAIILTHSFCFLWFLTYSFSITEKKIYLLQCHFNRHLFLTPLKQLGNDSFNLLQVLISSKPTESCLIPTYFLLTTQVSCSLTIPIQYFLLFFHLFGNQKLVQGASLGHTWFTFFQSSHWYAQLPVLIHV